MAQDCFHSSECASTNAQAVDSVLGIESGRVMFSHFFHKLCEYKHSNFHIPYVSTGSRMYVYDIQYFD